MMKVFVLGILIILVMNIFWFLSFQYGVFSPLIIVMTYIGPFILGLIIAYIVQKKKILSAGLMAIPCAIITVLMNSFFQLLDRPVDFPGVKGGIILFLITLSINVVLCLMGGIFGYFASRIKL
jgi:hypothetical protein